MIEQDASLKEIQRALYGKRPVDAHPRADIEKRTANGIVFDSVPEMRRYQELVVMQRAGIIAHLQYHPSFDIRWPGTDAHLCWFTPDFSYIVSATNLLVVEDVKGGKRTRAGHIVPRVNREFTLKRRLLKAAFGIDVTVVIR